MINQNVKLDNIAFIGPKQFENFTKASLFEVCTLKWLQLCSFQLNRFIELAINSGTKPYEFGFEEAVLSLETLCPMPSLLPVMNKLDVPPSVDELRKAINSLACGKAGLLSS